MKTYSFQDIEDLSEYNPDTGVLKVNQEEVAVFYLRQGFLPEHYTEITWKTRETMEKSKSIVCPDVFTQILNLKYFQHVINDRELWKTNGYEDEVFDKNTAHFCEIKTFEDFGKSKETLIKYIEENGGVESFVLKPQREGGANNYFGDDIKTKVEESSLEELSSHIVMKRIFPT